MSGEDEARSTAAPATSDIAAFRRARLWDFSILLPIVGAFLFASPIVRAFAQPLELWGAPMIVVYIFGVWALLILAAFALSQLYRHKPPAEPPPATLDAAPPLDTQALADALARLERDGSAR